MTSFRKTDEPPKARFEAAGLRWLAAAQDRGGASVVEILDEGDGYLDLVDLPSGPVTSDAAAAFGMGLAYTHAAGAPSLGCAPPGWNGEVLRRSGRMVLHRYDDPAPHRRWGAFYADYQIRPYIARARERGAVDAGGARVLDRVADRLEAGAYEHDQPQLITSGAARLHGDLWGGNVVWTAGDNAVRGVLIDPAAHGGHAETDLAALALFGVERYDDILAGYQQVSPLADGWRERIGLHQLVMLIMHAVIFGGPYGPETVRVAERYE